MRSAWAVSALSVAWTVLTGSVAIALGATSHSAVLGAFGAIGFVDAFGSIALVYHFHHGLRHDALSERLENAAHRVVVLGLFVVGLGAVVVGSVRLATGSTGGSSGAGTALAAISMLALAALAAGKRSLAYRVRSAALLADGRLSAIGAMQAAVTLFGTASARALGWHWADALAAGVVGLVAITTATVTARASSAATGLGRR